MAKKGTRTINQAMTIMVRISQHNLLTPAAVRHFAEVRDQSASGPTTR